MSELSPPNVRLASLPCGTKFKYYEDGPTWILHSKEVRDGKWHLWVQEIIEIPRYEDLELLDSADQFVFVVNNQKDKIMADALISTTLGELAKGDEFRLRHSDGEVFVKVADHFNMKSLFSDNYMVECKHKNDGNKRFAAFCGQTVLKLVKPLTLGELKPGEKFRFYSDGKTFTRLGGTYAYGYETHTYAMDNQYTVSNYRTGTEVERVEYVPF